MLALFFIPLATFSLNVIFNLFLLTCLKSVGVVKSLAMSTAVAFLVGIGIQMALMTRLELTGADIVGFAGCNLLIYLALSYCFFHVVHIPVASVRIRVLHELVNGQSLSRREIVEKYGADQILDMRLRRLTDTDQIVENDGLYRTQNKKIFYVAAIFKFVKKLVRSGEQHI